MRGHLDWIEPWATFKFWLVSHWPLAFMILGSFGMTFICIIHERLFWLLLHQRAFVGHLRSVNLLHNIWAVIFLRDLTIGFNSNHVNPFMACILINFRYWLLKSFTLKSLDRIGVSKQIYAEVGLMIAYLFICACDVPSRVLGVVSWFYDSKVPE